MAFLRKKSRSGKSRDRTEEILRKHLDGDFTVFPMAESKAMLRDLTAIGERFSVLFPPEFEAHVCGTFPGLYVEVKEDIWPRAKAYDVGAFWTFLYGLHTFTPCATSEDWMRLDNVAAEFQQQTGHIMAPILQIICDADVYCVDKSGDIFQFDHETNELAAEAIGFWELFEREIVELKNRKIEKVDMAKSRDQM